MKYGGHTSPKGVHSGCQSQSGTQGGSRVPGLKGPWESREPKPLLHGLNGCLRSNGVAWPQLRSEVLQALNPVLPNKISKGWDVGVKGHAPLLSHPPICLE